MVNVSGGRASAQTVAGGRWRTMLDAARGQALRLGDPDWTVGPDPYADRIDSFRAGGRTDQKVLDFLASRTGPTARVMEIGAGAGRLSLPLAQHVRELLALEPSPAMADALEADAQTSGVGNLRVIRGRWEDLDSTTTDAVFAAHVVYGLPRIEDFLLRLNATARNWCAVILFGEPSQSRVFDFWPTVFGEERLPNPYLPQVLDVLWPLDIFPEVSMLEVPMWPLGPAERARNGLRRRLHVMPGTAADSRLEAAMGELLTDWGDGQLAPRDRRPLQLGIVHWTPRPG